MEEHLYVKQPKNIPSKLKRSTMTDTICINLKRNFLLSIKKLELI